jgi:hypothetical protein
VEELLRDLARENQPISVNDLCDLAQTHLPGVSKMALKVQVYDMVKHDELLRAQLILSGRGHPVHPKVPEKAPTPRLNRKRQLLLDLAREHQPIGVLNLAQLARARGLSTMSEPALAYHIRDMLKRGQLPREWIILPGTGHRAAPLEGLEVPDAPRADMGNVPTPPPTDDAARVRVLSWLLEQSQKGELPAEVAQEILKKVMS